MSSSDFAEDSRYVTETNRYICIHGHFYQPPRENPWTGTIPMQKSASPYHNWNERITVECYRPNTAARLTDDQQRIVSMVNNFSDISFDFGPTLLSWLEFNEPGVYEQILEADRISCAERHGHGNAVAQVYNHIILPLANDRDKETQIYWGVEDFRMRFQRDPEGMWLAETAVDYTSLELLVHYGIKFTVLAPHQALRVRRIGSEEWIDVSKGSIDTRYPYRCHLPNGQSIILFFYNGSIAQEIAFQGLLKNGDMFYRRLVESFGPESAEAPQLVHVATDGESYGHHHKFGDMALAYVLHQIRNEKSFQSINYASYLTTAPIQFEVQIAEDTSWSCMHGVERWRSNCGCGSELKPGYSQAWRTPLRMHLNWLRDTLDGVYEQHARDCFQHPWDARNDYIALMTKRDAENLKRFFDLHLRGDFSPAERTRALTLLEMAKFVQFMFTSCGWFFSDVSGIETQQILEYAYRAVELSEEFHTGDLQCEFFNRMQEIKSNQKSYRDGAAIVKRLIKKDQLRSERLVATVTMRSLFEPYDKFQEFYGTQFTYEDYHTTSYDSHTMAVGSVALQSQATLESSHFYFLVLHLGGNDVSCGVAPMPDMSEYTRITKAFLRIYSQEPLKDVIDKIESHFDSKLFTLSHLFEDDQRFLIQRIAQKSFEEYEGFFTQYVQSQRKLMEYARTQKSQMANAYRGLLSFLIHLELEALLYPSQEPAERKIERILEEATQWNVRYDKNLMSRVVSRRIEYTLERLFRQPSIENVYMVEEKMALMSYICNDLDKWNIQTIFYQGIATGLLSNLTDETAIGVLERIASQLHIQGDTASTFLRQTSSSSNLHV